MTANLAIPVPFIIDLAQSTVEDITILCISILVAVTVSAESQAFAATFLGDSQTGSSKRHHFNAFMHLDILGTVCFFIAGFGWAKEVEVDRTKFKSPRLYYILCRLAGPLGNFMMANIAASIAWVLGSFGMEDKVFTSVIVVNMMTAVYGLLVIPPLPGAALLAAFLPTFSFSPIIKQICRLAGPVLLIGFFLLIRALHFDLTVFALNPTVRESCVFLRNFTL